MTSQRAPWARPPVRPSTRQEAMAQCLFLALAPSLRPDAALAPPGRLAPFELVSIPSRRGPGLSATWFPAPGADRGSVLLLPPWLAVGRAYFHRLGRIQALRAAGYDVLTVDLPGEGRSRFFFDRDIEDALAYLARRKSGPVHLWGVSSGGYWAHPVLGRGGPVRGAFFEDVSPHLLEWSRRVIPWGRPCYAFFRRALPTAYRYLDMRAHAASLRLGAVSYVSGGQDRGVLPRDTRALATAAGGRWHIVDDAGHLGAIKTARRAVIDLALETYERALTSSAPSAIDGAVRPSYPAAASASPPRRRSMSAGVL